MVDFCGYYPDVLARHRRPRQGGAVQLWARAMVEYRRPTLGKDDPHPTCIAPGGPRQLDTPHGLRIVQDRERAQVLVLSGGDPRNYRVIYLDGRGHLDMSSYTPTYVGHSIGHWEGDTLVVDSIGFNQRFWLPERRPPWCTLMHCT